MLQPIDLEHSKYSLGTTPIYNTLLKEIMRRNSPVEVVMINVSTLLRNCNSNESVKQLVEEEKRLNRETSRPSKQLINDAKHEIQMLFDDIVEMFRSNNTIINPTLIVYFCDYKNIIPKGQYREPSHSKRVLTTAEDILLSSMAPDKRRVTRPHDVSLVELPISKGKFPHILLADELGLINNTHRVAHITHHPIDYHIHRYTSDYRLIQSFTGNVIRPRDLGDKVFNNQAIPFNVYTHAVLGDGVDIKSSLSVSTKHQLMELAKKEHWRDVHTADWVRDRLRDIGIRIPFEIKLKTH